MKLQNIYGVEPIVLGLNNIKNDICDQLTICTTRILRKVRQ